MITKTCHKCNSTMHPGFPIEMNKGSRFATYWSESLPREISGIFGGSAFWSDGPLTTLLMGFGCEQCGLVELYKVTEDQLRAFLQQAQAEQK